MGALLAGAAMAANHLPATKLPATTLAVAAVASSAPALVAPAAIEAHMVVMHGRILNEKGLPLAGATVLQKGTSYGTSTDANGNYSLRVPAGGHATLQYGYGGYTEQEAKATSAAAAPVTLQPKAAKRKHWLFF
ncbi:MAG: hypothetical protein EOO56_11175 [Hymenobacter sp.]|nr:MAG: hypothetical protein EOO56_11175 [Hymenobacter sp.]